MRKGTFRHDWYFFVMMGLLLLLASITASAAFTLRTPMFFFLSLILLAILIFGLHRYFARKIAFDSAYEKEVFVSVIAKTTKTAGSQYGVRTIYYISFSFPDGARKNFVVDVDTFNTLQENDIGMLTYKEYGKHLFFLDFEHQF